MNLWRNAWRLAWRELRHGIRGFGVFLLCLFLGVFSVAAINAFSEASRAGLQADARSLLGGDVEFRLTQRPADPAQLEALGQQGTLSQVAELRSMARTDSNSLLVEVKAVDAVYPLAGELEVDRFSADAGLEPIEGRYGAYVDAALLQRLDLELGQTVKLGELELQIRGRILREPDRAIRGFTLGPRLMVSRPALQETGLVQPGSLMTFRYRLQLPDTITPKAVIQQLNQQFPQAGWRTRTYQEAAPRVREFIERLASNLTLVALCALLTGGLGVASAVRGYLASKRQTLATFKCLGASSQLIFSATLLQLMLLAAVGIAAGLLAGGSVPWLVQRYLGHLIPTPLIPAIYPMPLLLAALFGALMVIAFSLIEVGRARKTPGALLFRGDVEPRPAPLDWPVRIGVLLTSAALILLTLLAAEDRRVAGWFIVGALVAMLLFRLLARGLILLARHLPRPRTPSLRMALSNLHRPGSSAPAAVFALGLGLTALVVVLQVEHNLTQQVEQNLPQDSPAFFALGLRPDQVNAFVATIETADTEARIDRSPNLRGRIVRINGTPVDQLRLPPEIQWAVRGDRYISYTAQLKNNDELSAGNPWPADYTGEPLISLAKDLGDGFDVGIGDTLTVNVLGRDITGRIANIRQVDWANMEINFALLFSPGVLEGAPQTFLASAYVDPQIETQLSTDLAQQFPNVSLINVRQVLENVTRVMQRIGLAFRAIALVAVISGLLVLAGTVAADRRRRLYEAVLFKVCGATQPTILATYLAELGLVGLVAGCGALAVGSLAAGLMVERLMQLEFTWSPLLALATLAAGLLVPLLLGMVGTLKALREKPLSHLRND